MLFHISPGSLVAVTEEGATAGAWAAENEAQAIRRAAVRIGVSSFVGCVDLIFLRNDKIQHAHHLIHDAIFNTEVSI